MSFIRFMTYATGLILFGGSVGILASLFMPDF